jgi:MarR family 2-MHQ and catechol resistance regulon transcriptional repressor
MKPQPSQEPAIRAYVKLIRTAESLHARISRSLTLEGLTASQFSAMKVLRLHGTLPQRDIATYLLQTGGNITLVVDNLERNGLCQRVRDNDDRRMIFVTLTDKGVELFDRIYPGHLDRIRGVMKSLGENELEKLVATLDLLDPSDANICIDRKEPAVSRIN